MDFCKSQRPLQPIESLKTSPPHYQRPVHIPVQMVYPAIQKTSDNNRKKTDIRSDSDIKEHDIEDSNMADQQEDGSTGRRQRGFVPERMKDARYWVKRIKNNLAAKRSREKRRMADVVMESKVSKLAQENEDLRSELANIKRLVQNNLLKDARQEVVLGGRDALLPSQGTQTQFAVGAGPQSIPLIIPTYPNPLPTFPAPPPQGVLISPQSGLPQSTLPQPGLSQSGFPQAGLLRPMFLQDGSPQSRLPHQSFPQAVQPVRQQIHNLHGTQDSVKVVQDSSDATLVNGSYPKFISPEKNLSCASRSEFSDPSRLQVLPTCVEKDKSRPPSNPLQNSAVESIYTPAKAPNGVIKVRAEKVCSVVDVEITEHQEISERTAPVVESPMSESKLVSAEDDRKSVSASPNSSDTYDTPSPAEINKLPHKLRARFLRSLCQQEETAKTTVSDVHVPSDQPPMKADPILINIKKEIEDDVSYDEVSHVNSECPSGTSSSYPWILPKSEFPLHPLRSIEEELEQARNLLPTPNRTMTRSESQAYAELAKAAAELVGVRLQTQDFSAPSMRQLTRQRTRDMNQEEKYRDKRVRNNIAAKKCRDAKRLLIEYRSARSNFFEVENLTLRNEVESLTKDVIRLRELVRRKQLSHNTDAMEICTL